MVVRFQSCFKGRVDKIRWKITCVKKERCQVSLQAFYPQKLDDIAINQNDEDFGRSKFFGDVELGQSWDAFKTFKEVAA